MTSVKPFGILIEGQGEGAAGSGDPAIARDPVIGKDPTFHHRVNGDTEKSQSRKAKIPTGWNCR
jgi:hypothetical protein